jgi:predicted CoA-substrate-specific enzyme activase
MTTIFVGIDVGAETVRLVAVEKRGGHLVIAEQQETEHNKDPQAAVLALLSRLEGRTIGGVATTGRLGRILAVPSVPTKAALRRGARMVHPELEAMTVVSIGGHGFSVLELGARGEEWFQQNARCSQGTGNFLTQLVHRFGMSVEQASELCDHAEASPLSGRCPVILKTDMTHLANKGEDRARILAGLYDAVCENVLTLVRSRIAPREVVLTGGVTHSARVRRTIARWLSERGMHLSGRKPQDMYLEAIGAATHAVEHPCEMPSAESLFARTSASELEIVPALRSALDHVHRVDRAATVAITPSSVVLGFDIGSTGSKMVAIDAETDQPAWETYLNTEGSPVTAAQRLMERWIQSEGAAAAKVIGLGVTGSGREVVGSLLRTCYGDERVFIMNEIAAHARGATSVDPQVDTIFEIGGQDAKYIRLEGGRVIDAAMNEACSAGTGSFIAEQGQKFEGVGDDVRRLGQLALRAEEGISLGQHCSVFMAEVIDEAIAQGKSRDAIIAGLYDSVIQNYLNRVKGTRSIGQRIFCQGMPFSSAALAAAVARQTGRQVVVPPNPGTIGAMGIAMLAREELAASKRQTPLVDPQVFMGAKVVSKETFHCKSVKGCGGSGNKCRIDRLSTVVNGVSERFLWGGNCSLYDRGSGRAKLPDRSPDPFREREELVDEAISSAPAATGRGVVGMSDEFVLKQLMPFFITFVRALGFETELLRHAGGKTLKRGIEGARIPFCAPMQLAHGVMFELADTKPDFLLMPMLQELPRVSREEYSTLCPIVQAMPDIVGSLITDEHAPRVLRPIVRFEQGGYTGDAFRDSMRSLASELGAEDRFEQALRLGLQAQLDYERRCIEIGREALEFCKRESVAPVVVLGRPYTIYNDVLNSNVPSILRSLGALPIPVDCLPVPDEMPVHDDQYWAHTQRNLRAADFVRRTPGLYSVFCSNYACGPDSFTLHFYAYMMRGKPFTVVETDGHSGDAGTRTRMEAFLYCVDTDLRSRASDGAGKTDLVELAREGMNLEQARERGSTILVPRMGPNAEVAAAALRGEGLRAETLPLSTREDVRTGRRHTSGKECVPMMLTLGTMLNRIEKDRGSDETFAMLMPTARGPCRFGVYNTLHKIALEQTGWRDRVKVFSPDDGDYFRGLSGAFQLKLWVGFCAFDLLQAMQFDVRPVERRPGAANAIFERASREIVACMEKPGTQSLAGGMLELCGSMWGTREVLERAAREMSAAKNKVKDVPTVSVVGEIYVRLDPFANDFIVDKLEARGIRVRFAPFIEWLEYTSYLAEGRVLDRALRSDDEPISIGLTGLIQRSSLGLMYEKVARELGWGKRPTVAEAVEAATPYINPALAGEAVLTLGGPVHEFREGLVQGVVVVGPHECMPCKISEAQYGKVIEEMNLPYLVLALNGDPLDTEALDRFAYDLHEVHGKKLGKRLGAMPLAEMREPTLVPVEALTARVRAARDSAEIN